MKEADFVRILVASCLRAPRPLREAFLSRPPAWLELSRPRAPGLLSLVHRDGAGNESGFADWLLSLPPEGETLRVLGPFFGPGHPPLLGAFAGPDDLILARLSRPGEAQSGGSRPGGGPDSAGSIGGGARGGATGDDGAGGPAGQLRLIRIASEEGPRFAAGQDEFLDCLLAQPRPEPLLERLRALVRESNRMNGEEEPSDEGFEAWFRAPARRDFYELMADGLFEEVQIEARRLGLPFAPPAALEGRFEPPVAPWSEEPDPTVFLYLVGEPSGPELLALLAAHRDRAGLPAAFEREAAAVIAEGYLPPEDAALLAEAGLEGGSPRFRATLQAMKPGDAASNLGQALCRALAAALESLGAQPRIPPGLRELVGPDEEERVRASLRGDGAARWLLKSAEEGYRAYLVEEGPWVEAPPSEPGRGRDGAETGHPAAARKRLVERLAAARDLARELDSPFAEAFDLARELAVGGGAALGDGCGTEDIAESLVAALAGGRSDLARERLLAELRALLPLEALGRSREEIAVLAGLGLADQFGGMGSWNDLDPGGSAERYAELSGALYAAIREAHAALD